MIGAMVALFTLKALAGLPPIVSIPLALTVAVIVCMAVGFTIERVAYRPLRRAPKLAPLITAIGVSIIRNIWPCWIWGRNYHAFPAVFPSRSRNFRGHHHLAANRHCHYRGDNDDRAHPPRSAHPFLAAPCAPPLKTRRSHS